uniref:DUF4419 domain-containing protein n=1 Tax=Noctiluca scintillans TaxID=2966 RepID=A0A7S1A7G3_NOCSC
MAQGSFVPKLMARSCHRLIHVCMASVAAIAEILPDGVTFVATTNEKALQSTPLGLHSIALQDVFASNPTYKRAFPEGSASTIVQSSQRDAADVGYPSDSGLVSAVVEAYNAHHELVLRPDDVWQAVLTQFSFYVQANAEQLRDRFVNFEGKKGLAIVAGGTLFTADFGNMAKRMVDEQIIENLRDPSVAEWLLPAFTTTAETDRIVASVSIMATLQAYFDYKFSLLCGLPRVTLLGTPEDWRRLRAKVDRLPEFDVEAGRLASWHSLLAPVLDEFVRSAEGEAQVSFWDRVCSHEGGGSGPTYLSGWITVFAVFTDKGEWQGDRAGGSEWPRVDTQDLPVGVTSVPVLVDDNGKEYKTQMFAGQFAFDGTRNGTGIQPRSDWCIAMAGDVSS